jgi:hypothetical protein
MESKSNRIWRYAIAAATAACLALGVASVLRVVGWSNLSPFGATGAERPIAFDDYALQFYYGQLGSRFLAEGGVTYGYDPNFMAGYPKTPIYYPSSKPYEFSLRLFSEFDPASVFNRTVFFMLAVLPFLMYGAAANFRLAPGERLAVVAMSVVPHLMVPVAGFYGFMEAAGMVPYVFASFLSVYVVSLVTRFLLTGERRVGLMLIAAAPLLFLSHLTAVLISAVPITAIYLGRIRVTPPRRHIWMWLVLIAVAVANWPWIKGYLLFSHYSDLGEFYTPGGSEHFVPSGGLLAPLRVYVASPKLVSLIPPVFAAIGLWAWWRERRTKLLTVFLPQILFLFVVSFYGVHLGLNAVAPARITLPLGLYLFFPAAPALAAATRKAGEWIRRTTPTGRSDAVAAGAIAALVLAACLAGLPARIWRPYTLPKLEKSEGFTDHGMALIEWLRDNTDASGRILHEETNRKSHQYYGSHMPSWIPSYAGRELAGGPAPHALLKQNFLRFIAGTFRGKPIETVDAGTLSSYFSLYNVRWVLCWRRPTKRIFDRLPVATPVGKFDKFTLYRIEIPPSFFLRGSGRVEVQGSRIFLREITPEDGVVAIKYHWLESLRSDPPRTIEPLNALDDPIPFISVKDPPRELVIFNDFDHGPFQKED